MRPRAPHGFESLDGLTTERPPKPRPTDSQPAPTSSVRVDGITTEDLRPDQVLLHVTVDRDGRLETVALSLARTDSGWRVAEAAF